jgi:hypothetical protein
MTFSSETIKKISKVFPPTSLQFFKLNLTFLWSLTFCEFLNQKIYLPHKYNILL